MYYKLVRLWIALVFFAPIAMNGQTYEMSKRFDKSFKLLKTTEVNISNKYGNVHLLSWDTDSVRFEVEVNIRSSKESRVEKLYNEIDILFSQSPYYVNAISTFAGSGKLWTEISDVTKSMLNAGNEAEINYTVYLPRWAIVKVENRFGNIYTTGQEAACEFKLSNGTLQAGSLSGKTRLTIAFGNAIISHIEDGQLELNYAEIEVQSANKLRINTKSSDIRLGEVALLQINSRRDKINIEKLQSLSGETSFSRIELNHLQNDLLLQSNYGNLSLQEMGKEMQFLQLTASFTSIQIFVTREQSAGLEIQFSKKARLNYPQTFTVNEEVKGLNENEFSLLKGKLGNGKGSNLKFNLTGGELNILQR